MYKRQGLENTVASLGTSWNENQLNLLKRYKSSLCFIPVSYTHLDVYKRQVSGSASTTPDVLFSSITTGTVESDTGLLFPSGTEFKTSATGGTALLRCTKRATAEPILANIIDVYKRQVLYWHRYSIR